MLIEKTNLFDIINKNEGLKRKSIRLKISNLNFGIFFITVNCEILQLCKFTPRNKNEYNEFFSQKLMLILSPKRFI